MRVTRPRPIQRTLTVAALVAGLLVPLAALATPAQAAVDDTSLISRATDGTAADGSSHSSSASADGRFVAFASQADNLSGEDDNAFTNVFVRDRQSGSTTYVSRATGGAAANGDSADPSISADGRFVAFASRAENLSTEDMNSCPDWWWGETTPCSNIFVRDLLTGTTTYVSRPADGTAANGGSYNPSISGDGTRVAFTSVADNLSAQDANECYTSEGSPYPCANFFVRDLQAGSTTYLDVGSIAYGVELPCAPSISADGRFVAFGSESDRLPSEDNNGFLDVFVADLETGAFSYVSRADGPDGAIAQHGHSGCASISGDGRFVAFESDAYNLSDDDVDTADTHTRSVYVRDRQLGKTIYVSRANGATGAAATGYHASISADGRYVAFQSDHPDVSQSDADPVWDVFVRDLQTDATSQASRATGPTGSAGDADSTDPSISGNGLVVAFHSDARNLSTDDNDAYTDVFARELAASTTELPAQADLSVSMTASNTSPAVGTDVTFTVTLANAGPAGATGVAVTDQLPRGLTFASATPSQGTYAAETGRWSVGELPSSGSVTLELVAKPTSAGTTTNTAQVTAAGQADPDSTPGNSDTAEDDQASVTVSVTEPVTCPTVKARANADSWIGQNAPTTTHGTETTLKVRSKANQNARTLVRFTLPAIPDGCQITDATMSLNAATAISGRTLRAYAVAAPWTETAVTWNNRPGTTGVAATATSGTGWLQWTVTNQVKAMYTGANYGLLIRDNSESGSGYLQQFNSRENTTNPPELIVTFAPA